MDEQNIAIFLSNESISKIIVAYTKIYYFLRETYKF